MKNYTLENQEKDRQNFEAECKKDGNIYLLKGARLLNLVLLIAGLFTEGADLVTLFSLISIVATSLAIAKKRQTIKSKYFYL